MELTQQFNTIYCVDPRGLAPEHSNKHLCVDRLVRFS